jgi:nucleotide-binding universal stress UspA family protein
LVILSYADVHDINPRAMGTHGGGGVERYLLGSVAEKFVRLVETSALTVRLADSDDCS